MTLVDQIQFLLVQLTAADPEWLSHTNGLTKTCDTLEELAEMLNNLILAAWQADSFATMRDAAPPVGAC